MNEPQSHKARLWLCVLRDCGPTNRASRSCRPTVALHMIVACVLRFVLVTQTENQTVRFLEYRYAHLIYVLIWY